VLEAKPVEEVRTDHVAPIRASVADAILTVLDRLPERGSMTFRELSADSPTRLDAIVRFLAILELFKQGIVDLEQPDSFGVLAVRRIAEADLDRRSIADWDDEPEPAAPGTTEAP
jgi:segregation and condensation protein A